MKIKTMNLAKLTIWIIVAIQIFHFGAGKCGEELIVVNLIDLSTVSDAILLGGQTRQNLQ